MEFRTIEYGSEDYQKMVELRNVVLIEPIGLPRYYEDFFAKDIESLLCVCQSNNDIIAFAEIVAKENGYGEIILHARRMAEKFYLQNGYEFIGEEFEEVGVPLMEMRKQLEKI